MRGAHDDAVPNANAVMVSNLVALNLLTGKPEYLERAHAIPQAFAADIGSNPLGHSGLLANCLDLIAPQHVVVIETADTDQSAKLARAMFKLSLPGAVQQILNADQLPAPAPLAGKTAIDGQPTAYACLGPTCSLPITDTDAMLASLGRQRRAPAG